MYTNRRQPCTMWKELLSSYVAICGIFKNEHQLVREWVTYHRWIGVEKFYLFDHGSSPPMLDSIKDLLNENIVEYHYFNTISVEDRAEFSSPQAWVNNKCFQWFGYRHKFIALIDMDEFIVLNDPAHLESPNITTFLQPLEEFGGVKLFWRLFGSSGINQTNTDKGALASYLHYIPPSKMSRDLPGFSRNPYGYMKSIVNTKYSTGRCDPHGCGLRSPAYYVNGHGENISPEHIEVARNVSWDRIELFHYQLQSAQEYTKKVARGTGHTQFVTGNKVHGKTWQFFDLMNSLATDVTQRGVDLYAKCCHNLSLALH